MLLLIQSFRIVDKAVGVGQGHDLGAQGHRLLGGVLGDVAGAGHDHGLAFEALAAGGEHLLGEVADAVAGGLRAEEAAAPGDALAGQRAGELVTQALVLAEHEADLAAAHADVAGRHVGVGADVALELGHEALAEAHDLGVGLAARVEVGAALAATHREGGQGVLEGLLEGEELQDAEVDAGVETDTAFVRAEGAVHLYTVSPVDMDFALVVGPGDAEHDDPLRFDHPLKDLEIHQIRVRGDIRCYTFHHLPDSLVEFFLARVVRDQFIHEAIDVVLCEFVHNEGI